MQTLPQALGFLGMLLSGALGRGGRRLEGKRPLDWSALPLPGIHGWPLSPDLFAGHPVLVVNTASRCGFVPQYRGLQQLWEQKRDEGLVLLGVPSNDFAGQEPGSEETIRSFCATRFGVDFPMLAKQVVTGAEAHPLYRWAAAEAGPAAAPRWNFHKLLIGRDGRLKGWFAPVVGPASPRLLRAVEAAVG